MAKQGNSNWEFRSRLHWICMHAYARCHWFAVTIHHWVICDLVMRACKTCFQSPNAIPPVAHLHEGNGSLITYSSATSAQSEQSKFAKSFKIRKKKNWESKLDEKTKNTNMGRKRTRR
jgi:hypothetical protein